jgi:hypothetical protein
MSPTHPKATNTSLTISCRDGPRAEVAALLIYSWREAEETRLLFFSFGAFGA